MKNRNNDQLQTKTPTLIDQFMDIGEMPKAVKDLEKLEIERRNENGLFRRARQKAGHVKGENQGGQYDV